MTVSRNFNVIGGSDFILSLLEGKKQGLSNDDCLGFLKYSDVLFPFA